MPHPVTLTHFGHASWEVELGGVRVFTDPHASPRALVPKRYTRPGVPVEAWPPAQAVVVSHGHWDHCDVPTLRRVAPGTTLCYPPDLSDVCGRIPCARQAPLGLWESVTAGPLTVTAVPAKHFGRRWFRERPRGYCGFVLSVDDTHVYFAGDTAYFAGFHDIGARFALQAALLPVAAYEPEWFMRRVHCNPADSVQAFADLGARVMVPMHWGTFPLTSEAPDEPMAWTQDLMAARGWLHRLCTVPHGYRVTIPPGEPPAAGFPCTRAQRIPAPTA